MTNPEQPLRLPRMGHGVRWADVAAEIEADQPATGDETTGGHHGDSEEPS